MANIVLIVHLIIALFLIGVVLLQRSEGGALGMGGGGGGGGGAMSSRGAATALSKVTWVLAASFITTSLVLTILAASDRASESVLTGTPPVEDDAGNLPLPDLPDLPLPDLGGSSTTTE